MVICDGEGWNSLDERGEWGWAFVGGFVHVDDCAHVP